MWTTRRAFTTWETTETRTSHLIISWNSQRCLFGWVFRPRRICLGFMSFIRPFLQQIHISRMKNFLEIVSKYLLILVKPNNAINSNDGEICYSFQKKILVFLLFFFLCCRNAREFFTLVKFLNFSSNMLWENCEFIGNCGKILD